MAKTIEVDFLQWHLMKSAVEAMQGHTFYCEDEDGVLRRWVPPRVPTERPEPK